MKLIKSIRNALSEERPELDPRTVEIHGAGRSARRISLGVGLYRVEAYVRHNVDTDGAEATFSVEVESLEGRGHANLMHGAGELWSGSVGLRVDTGHLTEGISPGHQSVTVAAEGTWFVQFVLLAPMRRESDEVAACRAGSPLQLTGAGTRAQQVWLDAGIYGAMTSVRDNGTESYGRKWVTA